jgi:hypothetical protein
MNAVWHDLSPTVYTYAEGEGQSCQKAKMTKNAPAFIA